MTYLMTYLPIVPFTTLLNIGSTLACTASKQLSLCSISSQMVLPSLRRDLPGLGFYVKETTYNHHWSNFGMLDGWGTRSSRIHFTHATLGRTDMTVLQEKPVPFSGQFCMPWVGARNALEWHFTTMLWMWGMLWMLQLPTTLPMPLWRTSECSHRRLRRSTPLRWSSCNISKDIMDILSMNWPTHWPSTSTRRRPTWTTSTTSPLRTSLFRRSSTCDGCG